jgi:hypothetical protein
MKITKNWSQNIPLRAKIQMREPEYEVVTEKELRG